MTSAGQNRIVNTDKSPVRGVSERFGIGTSSPVAVARKPGGIVAAFAKDDPDRFAKRYGLTGTAAEMATEFETLGSDYKANGYTTMQQADLLGDLLELQPGKLLVDLGAGCGWPGLHMANTAGCAVISIDPVTEGCATARERMTSDGLASPSAAIRGDARLIPIRPASVDAVVHTDLLC